MEKTYMDKLSHEFRRYSGQYWHDHPEEHNAIVSEHIERAGEGKDYWNSWSESFKSYCEEKAKHKDEFVPFISFSEASLEELDFSGFNFLFYTTFKEADFLKSAIFNDAVFFEMVDFRSCKFMGDVHFYSAKFLHQTDFRGSEFSKNAHFSSTKFSTFAMLGKCKFYGDCHFTDVQFDGRAEFGDTDFFGRALFSKTHFFERAEYINSKFHKYSRFDKCNFNDDVHFISTKFLERLNFENSKFLANANFTGSTFLESSSFSNTNFGANLILLAAAFNNSVPDFNLATFKQAPHLNGVKVVEPKRGMRDGSLRYRKIKSMANSSNDHENELKFFGYELHAKAFEIYKPWYQLLFDVRFLSIKAYYLLSNFGQSLSRPVFALALFLAFMVFIVNPNVITPNRDYCKKANAQNTNAYIFKQVVTYTLSSSLPLVTLSETQKEAMDNCLFGDKTSTGNPKTLMHSIWRLIHLIPSTLLLFLFGLAVRNRFRI